MNEETRSYGQVYWEGSTKGDPESGEYDSLSVWYRKRCERGAQAVIAAYEADRKAAADQHRAAEETAATRYALVEQMGHRSTVASVRETTFCGAPMLEVTDLKTGSVHLAAPQSLYEVTWLTEDQARQRAKPWTATAITAGDYVAWGTAVSDPDDQGDDADDLDVIEEQEAEAAE